MKVPFLQPLILLFLVIYSLFLPLPVSAQAVSTPSFPTCINPEGEIIAQYLSGTHGIPGNTAEYHGSDTVYRINNNQVLQCFCPENGNSGIQTVWLKTSLLNEEEVSILRRTGWVVIPNGALWGLDPEAYITKNASFECRGVGGGTGGGDNGGGNGGSSNSSSRSGSSEAGVGGAVLGAATRFPQILGLASTGNTLNTLIFLALILIAAGTLLSVYLLKSPRKP